MKNPQSSVVTSTLISRWWFPALVSSFVVIGLTTVLLPKIEEIGTYRQEIATNQEVLRKEQAKLQALDNFHTDELEQMAALVNTALPNKKPLFEVLAQLQNAAAITGVILENFDLSPGSLATQSANKADALSLETKLSIKGTYDQINAFLDSLQNIVPLFTIDTIDISTANPTDSTGVTSATMKLDIYYYPIDTNKIAEANLLTYDEKTRDILSTVASYQSIPDASSSAVIDFAREDVFNY